MGNHDDPGERFHPQLLRLRIETAQPRHEDIGIPAPIRMMYRDELSAAPLRLLHPSILRGLRLDQPAGYVVPESRRAPQVAGARGDE